MKRYNNRVNRLKPQFLLKPRGIFRSLPVLIISLAVFGAGYAELTDSSAIYVHEGICDASAVVNIGDNEFAVADDELNALLVYQVEESGAARESFELSTFLDVVKTKKKKKKKKEKSSEKKKDKKIKVKEVDIEGAARVGNLVIWISSHARKSSGKKATERMRLFSTVIDRQNGLLKLTPESKPYSLLLDDFLKDERYSAFGLSAAAEKAPKESGGLNIEALTDRPDETLLIGFRSPLVNGRAIIAPLLNHQEVLQGERARLGAPLLVDLKGRGVRGLASHNGQYLIVANDPEGDGHHPALYQWDGISQYPQEVSSIRFGDFNPEAITILPDARGGKLLVLSDDGSREIGQEKCKDLKDMALRRFRSTVLRDNGLYYR